MPQLDSGPLAATVAANREIKARKRGFFQTCRRGVRKMRWIPGFLWILIIYTILALSIDDVRAPFATVGNYSFAWVEVLYVASFLAAILELLRVTRPGHDNTRAALMMATVLIGYVILFTLGASNIWIFSMFATSEFLVLMAVSAIQVIMAFKINSATLQRTIGTGGHDHEGYDD